MEYEDGLPYADYDEDSDSAISSDDQSDMNEDVDDLIPDNNIQLVPYNSGGAASIDFGHNSGDRAGSSGSRVHGRNSGDRGGGNDGSRSSHNGGDRDRREFRGHNSGDRTQRSRSRSPNYRGYYRDRSRSRSRERYNERTSGRSRSRSPRFSDRFRDRSRERSYPRENYRKETIVATQQVDMLKELTKEAIDRWYVRLKTLMMGGVEVLHVNYILPALMARITVTTSLVSPGLIKPDGLWQNWSLEELVRVLLQLSSSSQKSQSFTPISQALSNIDWEQSVEHMSLDSIWDQMDKIRKEYGLASSPVLKGDELKALVNTIKSKLKAPGIKPANKTFNFNLIHILNKFEVKPDTPFDDLLVAIGNYNLQAKELREKFQAMVGKIIIIGDSDHSSDQGKFNKGGSSKTQYGGEKKKPRTSFSESAKSDKRQEKRDGGVTCNTCGKSHSGDCRFKNHPNANNSKLPWKDSYFGKIFQSLDWTKLPEHKCLSADKKSLIPWENKEARFENIKIFSINLNNTVNNEQATFKWNQKGLIDSGARGGGPFIDHNLADKLLNLKHSDFKLISTKEVKINVPFNGVGTSKSSIRLCIRLSHSDKSVMINETFIIVKGLGNDILIDEDTIKKYKLTRVFDEYFTDEKGKEDVNFNICDWKSCETCLEPILTGAGSAGNPHPLKIAAAKLSLLDSYDHEAEYTEVHISDILPPEDDVGDGLDHETVMDRIANKEAVNDSDDSYLLVTVEGSDEFQTKIRKVIYKY